VAGQGLSNLKDFASLGIQIAFVKFVVALVMLGKDEDAEYYSHQAI